MLPNELIAPIAEDLRKEDKKFDIIKGIEHINYVDGKLADGANVEEGDWVVKTATGFGLPTSTASAACFPVVTGNNRYDALATKGVTVAVGGGFLYETTKYVAGSYTIGQNLTVKDLGAGEKVPSAAGGSDAVLGRVWAIDTVKNIMTILVVNR